MDAQTEAKGIEAETDAVVEQLQEKQTAREKNSHRSDSSSSQSDEIIDEKKDAGHHRRQSKSHRHRRSKSSAIASHKHKHPKSSSSASKKDGDSPSSGKDKDRDLLAHLPPHEQEILRRQLFQPDKPIGYRTLFRYASKLDLLVFFACCFASIAAGALLPLMTVVFGTLSNTFKDHNIGVLDNHEFEKSLQKFVLYFVYLGVGEFVMIYFSTVGFITAGENITARIREEYLRAILRQNIAFFDKLGSGEITTRITTDMNFIQDSVSEKVGLTLTTMTTFLAAFVIGFVRYWKLTLILISIILAIVVAGGIGSRFIVRNSRLALVSYGAGGTVAEEVLSSIRNTQAFSTQGKLAKLYQVHLAKAEYYGFRQKGSLGTMMGVMMCISYLNFALAFWQGSKFLVRGEMSLGALLNIIMAVMIGAFSLNQVAPNLQAFTTGIAAAHKVFNTIDRKSPLDPDSVEGDSLDSVKGSLELINVKHIYPSRPEVTVMDGINLKVPAGSTTALVGASGSGKSTIVGLVERFYDPVGGSVLLDGHDIQSLNLRWLRQQISLVSQEPVLFSTTVFQNIAFGLIGTRFEGASEKEKRILVENAAREANAHDFVSLLPDGYDTKVGERGLLLSGGQRQRIAIARAVVSDPKVLLLDEATSALDTKSEGIVQAALDKASVGRTTIVIAHRLSTIKGADNIVVMAEGRIVEQGTHNELLEKRAAYFSLVEAQRIAEEKTEKIIEQGIEEAAAEDEAVIERVLTEKLSIADPEDAELAKKLRRTKTSKSESSVALKERPHKKENKYGLWTLIKFIGSFNKQEWYILLVGFIGAAIGGLATPVQAVFFAKCVLAMSVPPSEYGQLLKTVHLYAGLYVMLAVVIFIVFSTQGIAFAYCSERLIYRARDRSFNAMMRQDIEFFDDDENSSGALTSFLATETTHLAGLSGVTLGTIVTVVTTLVGAVALSLAIGWKLALVTSSTIPVLLACGFLRFRMLSRFQQRSRRSYEESAAYACEATSSIRTVASLTREKDVWDTYHSSVSVQKKKSFISVAKSSTLYAASQSLMFLCIALGFWYGGTLIGRGEYSIFQFFVCYSSIIQGAQSSGAIFSFAPDMGKAKYAAERLKNLLDRKPIIDSWSDEGEPLEEVEGYIEFRDVHFRYPSRPHQPVLRGLNISVKPGQYVALVGPSGCGKSTTIQLMERFYDPLTGAVFIDGKEVSTLNIKHYRNHLALVSQEPTLYQGTIRENILLGVNSRDEDVPEEAVVKACKDANIYDFIMSLPEGFSTVVGNKGTMLSGGQKQRVAIARALLRDPKILLLDEATSALDSESEKVVQAALDSAMKGRTTIAVAHRLSTIQRADAIFVIDGGVVVEQGTHRELMAQKGRYFELVNMQSLEKRQ